MVIRRVNSDRSQNSSRHSDEQLMIQFTSQGLEQSPCLIQKRRQISSTLQPTWANPSMTRLFAFRVSIQLVAIACIPTYRLLSAFVILQLNRCSVFMF